MTIENIAATVATDVVAEAAPGFFARAAANSPQIAAAVAVATAGGVIGAGAGYGAYKAARWACRKWRARRVRKHLEDLQDAVREIGAAPAN